MRDHKCPAVDCFFSFVEEKNLQVGGHVMLAVELAVGASQHLAVGIDAEKVRTWQ